MALNSKRKRTKKRFKCVSRPHGNGRRYRRKSVVGPAYTPRLGTAKPAVDPAVLARSISTLGYLTDGTRVGIKRAGITTLGQLYALDDTQLPGLFSKRLAAECVREVKAKLASAGLH